MARVCGLACVFIGAVVLVGWALNITPLKSVFPALVSMKPNTAVGILLCGIALAFLARARAVSWSGKFATGAALFVMALGALTLSEYVVGWDLGIDQLLFSDQSNAVASPNPGRMSPASALCFLLAGGALFTAAQHTFLKLRQPIVAGLGSSVMIIGALALVGYVMEARHGYHLWNYTGTALHTAIAFILFGGGLLALVRSEGGLTWFLDAVNTTAFLVAVLLMILAAGSAYNFAKRLQQTNTLVGHTQATLQEMQEIVIAVASMESDQRGFVITGDDQFLARFEDAKRRTMISVANVRRLTADEPDQQRRLNELGPLLNERIRFADRIITAHREQGFSSAQALIGDGTGIELTDRIRTLVQSMADEEQTLLHERQRQSSAASLTTFLLLPLGLFLSLVTLAMGVFLLNAEVGERTIAEQKIRESQAQMAGIVDSAMDAIITVDEYQRIVVFNAAAERMFGYSAAAVIGESLERFLPDRFRLLHARHIRTFGETSVATRVMAGTRAVYGLRANGEEFPVEASISQIESNKQKLYTVILRDITERKRAEEALQEHARILDLAPVLIRDLDGRILFWNKGAQQMYGWNSEEALEKNSYSLLKTELPKPLPEINAKLMTDGHWEGELSHIRKDGQRIFVASHWVAHRDAHGRLSAVLEVNNDITGLKQAEKALRASEERLQLAIESTALGTWEFDPRTGERRWSDQCKRIFGFPTDAEVNAAQVSQSIHPQDRQQIDDIVTLALRRKGTGEVHTQSRIFVGEEKALRWVESHGRGIFANGEVVRWIGTVLDITERKRAEEALRESEERLRLGLQAAHLGSWDYRFQTGEVFMDERGYRNLGMSSGHTSYDEAIKRIHSEDQDAVNVRVQEALEGKHDGAYEQEFRVLWPDGSVHWLAAYGQVYFEGEGDDRHAVRYTGVNMDITERKLAEEEIRKLNEELEQRVAVRTAQLEAANKELEAFSYSVSHDLRAPLRHINGYSQALLEDYADKLDDVGAGFLHELRGATQEMAQLIDDLLELARVTRTEMQIELVDLSEVAGSVASQLERENAGRTVTAKIQQGMLARGDRRLFRVMLTNLLGNAWKFTSKREQAVITFGQLHSNGETVYFIRDNGAGFDMAYVDKLFGAFQRLHTASDFEGTGIGLATVQRIVNRHGGRVWAEGELNQGATFYFTLPSGGGDHEK